MNTFSVVDVNREKLDIGIDEKRTLAQTIWLSGLVPPPALCSGLGRCGACRVRLLEGNLPPCSADTAILGAKAVAEGWRLGCRHQPVPGLVVALPAPAHSLSRKAIVKKGTGPFRLAVDMGTTSVHWRLLDAYGENLFSGQTLNPQMGAGSDVVSRIAEARTPAGRHRLRQLMLKLLAQLVEESHVAVGELCIAGNTAMTSILMDKDVSGLAVAPYNRPESGGRTVRLADLPPVWIPPQPAPFVGGDISAGMAFLLYKKKASFPFLLADLGTNGEFVLALDAKKALVTSIPLGPSLEGIGLACGGIAETGSVAGFAFGPTGLQASVIGGGTPQRICGTGYLSLLDVLLRLGVLEASGQLGATPSPLADKILRTVHHDNAGWRLPLPGGLWLHAADVEEVLKVKAAFSLALEALLHAATLERHALKQIFLGGALGEHVPAGVLESLGFLSPGMDSRVSAVGNTSLEGAQLLLMHPELRERLNHWSEQCQVVNLVDRADFTTLYMQHMRFS